MIDGKQIKNATVTESKIAPLPSTPSNSTSPTSREYVDNAIAQSINNQDWKASCRVSVGTNVNTVSPGATLDGVAMNNGDRVLLRAQTTASQNWIWVWNGASSAMTRATDADGNSEVTAQAAVSIEEGSTATKSFRITNTGAIIVGTTSLTVDYFLTFTSANPSTGNKFMTASATTIDGDVACATGIASTPASNSFVAVRINGDCPEVGDGVKTKDCYFSGNSGTTARAFNAIVATDKLYWNGSIAGYQLTINDKVSFEYNV